jgi:membrane dipeptidase
MLDRNDPRPKLAAGLALPSADPEGPMSSSLRSISLRLVAIRRLDHQKERRAPSFWRHLALCVALLLAASAATAEAESALERRAAELHREAIVVDGHNDVASWIVDFGFDLGLDGWEPGDRWGWLHLLAAWLPWRPAPERLRTHTDLGRLESGGIDALFFSVWPSAAYYDADDPRSGRSLARANEIIDALERQVERHGDRLELARGSEDIRRIAASGRIAALLGVEGGHAIEHDLANLRALYDRGVRYMTLTWSFSHSWADASGDPLNQAERLHGGLTEFGEYVVREMNALGMLVDISHVSDETFWDALAVTRAPVIASHSSLRALAPHPRNVSDAMLEAVAESGGVVMINFSTMYLDPRKTTPRAYAWDWVRHAGGSATTVANVADHIDHVVRVAGVDHVGLGSDFDGTTFLPEGLRHVGEMPNLTTELLRRGYAEPDIRKILGENLLRVLAEAEARRH